MNNRRKLVMAFSSAVSIPGLVVAQTKKPPTLIGFIHGGGGSGRGLAAFKEGMAELGWKEGEQFVVEARYAKGREDLLQPLAEQLVAMKPAVIVATLRATAVAARAAPNIPVVQALGSSPVEAGLAKTLAHPGGMVTGVTNVPAELSEKFAELLFAAAPKLVKIGFLVDRNSTSYAAFIKNSRRAIERYRVETKYVEVKDAEELDAALALLANAGVQGLIVSPSAGLFSSESKRIVNYALAQRWPVVAGPVVFSAAGALLTYSGDSFAHYRRAAYYVDRILKGAKPGNLPIEQPMTFQLVLNLKTAKALGLTMPPEIMVQVTRIIQ